MLPMLAGTGSMACPPLQQMQYDPRPSEEPVSLQRDHLLAVCPARSRSGVGWWGGGRGGREGARPSACSTSCRHACHLTSLGVQCIMHFIQPLCSMNFIIIAGYSNLRHARRSEWPFIIIRYRYRYRLVCNCFPDPGVGLPVRIRPGTIQVSRAR